jgi:hypothetical protein
MVTILLIQANPRDQEYLRLKQEYVEIDRALRESQAPEYRIIWEAETHPEDLLPLLQRHHPDIVHFSGHGTDTGELLFQNNDGVAEPIDTSQLTRVFSLFRSSIKCVVLNSCYSKIQAKAIARSIPVVVGMSRPITDAASLNFASALYRALGGGTTLNMAFEIAAASLGLTNKNEKDTPRLLENPADAADAMTVFIKPSILASFKLNQSGKPIKKNGEFALEVWLENAPVSVLEVAYQYNYPNVSDPFEVIPNNGTKYYSEASLYGDVQIRAMIWTPTNGYGIVRLLSEALLDYYQTNGGTSAIFKAIKQFKSR